MRHVTLLAVLLLAGLAPGEYWLELGVADETDSWNSSPEDFETLEHLSTGDVAIWGVFPTPRILAWIEGGEGNSALVVGGPGGRRVDVISADSRGLVQLMAEQGRGYSLSAHRASVRRGGNGLFRRIHVDLGPAGSQALEPSFPSERFELEVHLTLPLPEAPSAAQGTATTVSHK